MYLCGYYSYHYNKDCVRKKILSYYKIMIIIKRLTEHIKKMIYILYVLHKFKAKF